MARQDDYVRVTLRLPPELHEKLFWAADASELSLNSEVINRLSATLAKGKSVEARSDPSLDAINNHVEVAWDFIEEAAKTLNEATKHLHAWETGLLAKKKRKKR